MDSLNKTLGIIASAIFRVHRVVLREVFQKTKNYLTVKFNCNCNCNSNQEPLIAITTRFAYLKFPNNTQRNEIIEPHTELKVVIQSAFKLLKLSTYIKSLKTELIIPFNSVYQHITPFLLFSNVLCKRKMFCVTNKNPRSEMDIDQDIGSMK